MAPGTNRAARTTATTPLNRTEPCPISLSLLFPHVQMSGFAPSANCTSAFGFSCPRVMLARSWCLVLRPSRRPSPSRRLVTVLFADLVGFTTASEGRDAEETRDLLSRYFDLARTLTERFR